MAYKEPDTAVHHLKMAQAYFDDVAKLAEKDKNKASMQTADSQLQILVTAAQHLNKARTIDPNEVLWREDQKDKTAYKVTQDYLNGDLLILEGIAHLNAALDISASYDKTSPTDRPMYERGQARLAQARDALEKALTYIPYSDEAYSKLTLTYKKLGDLSNYRRVLEKHVEISPEKIELHKEIAALNAQPVAAPTFVAPPPNIRGTVRIFLWLGIPLGFIVGSIGGANNISALGGFGVILFLASALLLFVV